MIKFIILLVLVGLLIFASLQFAPIESMALVKSFADYFAKMTIEVKDWVVEIINGLKGGTVVN